MWVRGLLLVSLFASTFAEIAYLEDLTSEHARRNFGLPEDLQFRLHHSGGALDLDLKENKRLNAGAPIFVSVKDSRGHERIVEDPSSLSEAKHYQDRRNGAFMTVACVPKETGPCVRELKGNLVMQGKEYSLNPEDMSDIRIRGVHVGAPHSLRVIEAPMVARKSDGKKVAFNDVRTLPAGLKNDAAKQKLDIPEVKRRQMIDSLISRLEGLKLRQKRQTSGPVAHGIEMLLVIDHVIYREFAKRYTGDDQIKLRIREYFSHIINGVDLRYASIQEADVSFYVTVSGFFISKNAAQSPWMDYTVDNPDADSGLDALIEWRKKDDVPKHDHAALMTGSDVASGGSTDVVGLAYLSGVCRDTRVSLNEDLGFFTTSGVLAHELGHNLGADHDEGGDGSSCNEDAEFIMQPFVPNIESGTTTINPWRFSSCSINAFKAFIKSLGEKPCTLNRGKIYNEKEFKLHTAGLAGQLYSEDQQCQLLVGGKSKACTGNLKTAAVCRNLRCSSNKDNVCGDDSSRFLPAHGTPCGGQKICFEGLCVAGKDGPKPSPRPSERPPQPTKAPTKAPTDAPTVAPTDAPTVAPTNAPTDAPTDAPSAGPTDPTQETTDPTNAPTDAPSQGSTDLEGSTQDPTDSTQDPTDPTEGPTVPTQEPTDPTEGPTDTTQGPTVSTQEPSDPTEGSTDPTEGPTNPTEGPSDPTQEPTDPTEGPTDTTQGPTVSTQEPSDPTEGPTVPTQEPTDPNEGPTDTTQGPTVSTQEPSDPTEGSTDPTEGPTNPTEGPSDPTQEPTDPTEGPTDTTQGPTVSTQEPTEPTLEPSDPTEGPTGLTQEPTFSSQGTTDFTQEPTQNPVGSTDYPGYRNYIGKRILAEKRKRLLRTLLKTLDKIIIKN